MFLSIVTNDQLTTQRFIIDKDFQARSRWRKRYRWYTAAREKASNEIFRTYNEVQQKYGDTLFKEYVRERHLNEKVYQDVKAENLDYEMFGKFANMKEHMDEENRIISFYFNDSTKCVKQSLVLNETKLLETLAFKCY
uniref:Uncharacterized protein n=1 Tax=Glossina austeni TaxID=7395 RepID=A0A1A9V0Q3_GLOAU